MAPPRTTAPAPSSRALAFDLIRARGPISRVELAQLSGFTQATMSNVVRQLLTDGLVVEAGRLESTGGKPRVLLDLDPRSRHAVGVQLGADRVMLVLTDLAGELVAHRRLDGVRSEGPAEAVARLADTVSAFLDESGVDRSTVAGLGLVAPGPLDLDAGTVLGAPPLESWSRFPLRDAVARATGLPVILDNDATAAALGEFWAGSVGDSLAHCTVYVGAGIGVGIVLAGRIYRGASSNAGELGQVRTRLPGTAPGERTRTVEELAGPVSVAKHAREALAAGRTGAFTLTPDEDPWGDYAAVAEAAVAGDPLAGEILAESTGHLADAVVSLANVLDLDSVVLAGPALTSAGPLYVDAVRERMADGFFAHERHGVTVSLSARAADAAALGGAALVLQRHVDARTVD